MKRWIAVILLLSLSLTAAVQARLVRFDVINKSGDEIAVRMNGRTTSAFYYLRIPAGTREAPWEANFTVASDFYHTQLYYMEPEEPIRALRCRLPRPAKLSFAHNVRWVVLPCVHEPVYTGEPYMLKFPIEFTPY